METVARSNLLPIGRCREFTRVYATDADL